MGSGVPTGLFFRATVTLRKALINLICLLSSPICKEGMKLFSELRKFLGVSLFGDHFAVLFSFLFFKKEKGKFLLHLSDVVVAGWQHWFLVLATLPLAKTKMLLCWEKIDLCSPLLVSFSLVTQGFVCRFTVETFCKFEIILCQLFCLLEDIYVIRFS